MVGSIVSSPTIMSMSGSRSRAWAMRPPQKVPSPVTRTRLLTSTEPHAAPGPQHLVQGLLEADPDGLGLVHDAALGVALLGGGDVEEHRVEPPPLELGRPGDACAQQRARQ